MAAVTSADRPAPHRLGGFPLWALGPAGLCVGLTLSLALSRGGLPLAVGVVFGIVAMARPWGFRQRQQDRRHKLLMASRPLRDGQFHALREGLPHPLTTAQ